MSAQDAVAAVEDALVAVLFNVDQRQKLHNGDDLGLSSQLAADLRTPSRCDVDALADEICTRLTQRANRGVGRLQNAFPKTIAACTQASGEAPLFEAFLASPESAPWMPVPFAGLGPCLEQCFADWATQQPWADDDVVLHELLTAVCRALATDPTPAFVPPTAFRGQPGHWVAVTIGASPTVFAAVQGKVVTGPITPLIAGLLQGQSDADLAVAFGVPEPRVAMTRQAVVQKGLLQSTEPTDR